MNRIGKAFILVAAAVAQLFLTSEDIQAKKHGNDERVVVAYVTSWSGEIPNPHYMTHINYAFGHVNDSADGVRIDNESRFRKIAALKKENPALKVLLSVGGGAAADSARWHPTKLKEKIRGVLQKDSRGIWNRRNRHRLGISGKRSCGYFVVAGRSRQLCVSYTRSQEGIGEEISSDACIECRRSRVQI